MNKRQVTDEDIIKYIPMVEKYIRDSVVRNWTEASIYKSLDYISIGNTAYTMEDFRQYLKMQVVVALQNYNPEKGTKESTFVYTHLFNRIGSLMKSMTKKKNGYGVHSANLEKVLFECSDID
jgi:hypothetical protein